MEYLDPLHLKTMVGRPTCNGLGPVILWVGVLLPVGGVGGSGEDTASPTNAVL